MIHKGKFGLRRPSFGIRLHEHSFVLRTSTNMPPRRRGASIGRGRPVVKAVLLDEIQNLRTRMETMETTQGEPLMKAMSVLERNLLRKKKRMKVKLPKFSRYWPKQVEDQRWKYLFMTGISM